MTQDQEQARPNESWAQQARAPWPLVERRAEPRRCELGRPLLHHLPRQAGDPAGSDRPSGPTAAAVRRVLPVDAPSRVRRRAPALLADLLGVVLLVSVAGSAGPGVVLALVWCLCLVVIEVSGSAEPSSRPRRVLVTGGCLVLAAAFAAYAVGLVLPRPLVLGALPAAVLLSTASRVILPCVQPRRVVLVGSPDSVVPTRALLARSSGEVSVVGICCPAPSAAPASIGGIPVVGDLDELAPTVWRGGVDVVVVCSAPETSGPVLRRIVWDVEGSGVSVLVAPGIVELAPQRLHLSTLAGLPLLRIRNVSCTGAARSLKHAVDRLTAALGLVLLLPLLVAIGFAVRCTTPGPALFRQVRVGQDGRTFTLLKFRSMHLDAEQRLHRLPVQNKHEHGPLFKIEDDPRVTPVGRFLRRSSLDELPQLLNVLRGEMSLVGPRPPLPSEASAYCDPVPRRLMVRPGLTGLWQVSGRADLSWDESARLDLYYVENWSLRLDASILRRTFGAVVRGRGAY